MFGNQAVPRITCEAPHRVLQLPWLICIFPMKINFEAEGGGDIRKIIKKKLNGDISFERQILKLTVHADFLNIYL